VIVRGRDLPGGFECSVDVCVVGSGAAGAVVAKELSESGLSVCVLEEGGYYTPEEYGRFSVAESSRRLLRNGAGTLAHGAPGSPTVQIWTGRTVGGGSVLTGGVCFRIPDRVLDAWCKDGLDALSPKRMEPLFERVEREIGVEATPEALRSGSAQLFALGAKQLSVPMLSLRRNAKGCQGAGRCTLGCPNAAKQSVDITYLRKAEAHGTTIHSDCIASHVITREGRAVGVTGRVLGGAHGRPGARFTVHARAVVVAAGALHTPLLLRASGLSRRSGAVGRNLSLHPSFGVGALSPTRVDGWQGAQQSVFSDHLKSEGITLLSAFAGVNVLASRMPGVGEPHLAYARQLPNFALFGGIVSDTGRGVVRRGLGREPIVTYRMSEEDKATFARAFCFVGEMAFAGGATEILLPVNGLGPIRSVRELRELALRPPPASRFQAVSFHPLGTARMGRSAEHDVVSQSGESHEVLGLYVADGSIFRTPVGVNAQVPIMAVATHIAWGIRDRWARRHGGTTPRSNPKTYAPPQEATC
jgi:choline dehydrogenase-like flavoprotein